MAYSEKRVLPVVTLTSIATVIGSGILALPVTLYNTSVPVFIAFFTLALCSQMAVVYAIVELLQRARHTQFLRSPFADDRIKSQQHSVHPSWADVSLYALARLFLRTRLSRLAFHIATLFSFIATLVSYGLAGPQAVWQMIISPTSTSTPPSLLFAVYWFLGAIAVIFWVDQLLPVFGSFTVVKGALFIAVIFIVASLPNAARVASLSDLLSNFSDWTGIPAPFLMSCVALGGLANTCPVTFNMLPPIPTPLQVRRYRAAVILALVICYLLNIGWVLAVLQIVPRSAHGDLPSLTQAYYHGQISTVPLIATISRGTAVKGAIRHAINFIVETFIMVSTGVSYFVMSAGMKSFLDGFMKDLRANRPSVPLWAGKSFSYLAAFGSILLIILANPQGFISVLTRYSSMALNFQAGFMVFIMLYNSRSYLEAARPLEYTDLSEDAVLQRAAKTASSDVERERTHSFDSEVHSPHAMRPAVGVVYKVMNGKVVRVDDALRNARNGKALGYDSLATSPLTSPQAPPTEGADGLGTQNWHTSPGPDTKPAKQQVKVVSIANPIMAVIPVIMPAWQFRVFAAYGIVFFAIACLLAAIGPMLGIKLGAHE